MSKDHTHKSEMKSRPVKITGRATIIVGAIALILALMVLGLMISMYGYQEGWW
ncbi:MAG: hypothetical protein OQK24_06290 [Magnetovibrio sp.]|nr:hypothetical protein [Magnetovibrio sp.]